MRKRELELPPLPAVTCFGPGLTHTPRIHYFVPLICIGNVYSLQASHPGAFRGIVRCLSMHQGQLRQQASDVIWLPLLRLRSGGEGRSGAKAHSFLPLPHTCGPSPVRAQGSMGRRCIGCPSGCLQCRRRPEDSNAFACSACIPGYSLDAATGSRCLSNCWVAFCRVCGTGSVPEGGNGVELGKCEACEPGYFLVRERHVVGRDG